MSKTCQHRDGGDRIVRMSAVGSPQPFKVNICWLCNEWLPLGPANDEPEAVRTEIRAAEIAAIVADSGFTCFDFEWAGSDIGYLARTICEHDDGGGE